MSPSPPKVATRRRIETAVLVPGDLPPTSIAQREKIEFLRSAGISHARIEALRRRLLDERATFILYQSNAKAGAGWPTVGQERRALADLADLAEALTAALDGASPRGQAEIATAALLELGDPTRPLLLARELRLLALGLRKRIEKVPAMPKVPVGFVRAVVDVLGEAAGKPSTATNSKFMNTCRAAFVLASWDKDPKRAVEAYIASMSAQGDMTS